MDRDIVGIILSGAIVFYSDPIRQLPMRVHIGRIVGTGTLPTRIARVMCTATLESPAYSGIGPGTTAEAPPDEPAVRTGNLPLPAELLDGGEVVILARKPSLWFVLFDSIQWMVAGAVVIVGAALAGGHMDLVTYSTLVQGTLVVVACRIGIALLRWVSRFYVLTNRRTLHIHGVLRAHILGIALTDILNTRVTVGWHERPVGLGTLRFACEQTAQHDTAWHNLASPDEVHAEVRRAIERAIDQQQSG